MRFLILLVFACPFDNVWEIQPFPLIIGTHDHTMTIIDEVLQYCGVCKQTRAIRCASRKQEECTHGGIPGYGVSAHPAPHSPTSEKRVGRSGPRRGRCDGC